LGKKKGKGSTLIIGKEKRGGNPNTISTVRKVGVINWKGGSHSNLHGKEGRVRAFNCKGGSKRLYKKREGSLSLRKEKKRALKTKQRKK